MQLKSLRLTGDLYEKMQYDEHVIPLVTCIDNFDDFLNHRWETHWHEGFEFTTVIHGSCCYTIRNGNRDESITLKPHDGIFINSGTLHEVQALDASTQVACFVLPPTFFNSKLFETLRNNSITPILNSGFSNLFWQNGKKLDREITENIETLCRLSETDIDYELQSVELVCRIWRLMAIGFRENTQQKLIFSPHNQTDRVRIAIQFIHENYQRSHITVADIAEAINSSRAECFRAFKAVTHITPIAYLNNYRMSMAEMLLKTTSRTIKDISQMCGFTSSSYFSSEFRKKNGVTPKKYRH